MEPVKRQWDFFRAIPSMSKKQQKVVLFHLTDEQIRTICELAANVLAKNIKLSETDKHILKRHRGLIRKLAARGATSAQRHSIINKNVLAVVRLIEVAVKRLNNKL